MRTKESKATPYLANFTRNGLIRISTSITDDQYYAILMLIDKDDMRNLSRVLREVIKVGLPIIAKRKGLVLPKREHKD